MIGKPLLRRFLAAIVLYGCAIGSVVFWHAGDPLRAHLPLILLNSGFATIGLLVLHLRWKRREARMLTPDRVRNIFS